MSWRTVWAEWSRFSPAEIKIWATHQWFLFGYTPNNDICNLTIYNFEMYLFIYFLHTAQYTRLSRGNSSALYAYTHTLIFFGPIQPWFEKLYVSHPGALPLRSVWTNKKRSWQDLSKRIETCGSVEPITERLSPARFELVVVSVWRSTKPEYDQSDTEQRRMS